MAIIVRVVVTSGKPRGGSGEPAVVCVQPWKVAMGVWVYGAIIHQVVCLCFVLSFAYGSWVP